MSGFGARNLGPLKGNAKAAPPPRYIPVIQAPFRRIVAADWAAIPLKSLMRGGGAEYRPRAATKDDLRLTYGLPRTSKIVLLGVGKDAPLETYWRWRRKYESSRLLASLAFEFGVPPNYSFYLEDPRPEHLFNRKRSLICASEWSAAGITSAVYLHAIAARDWEFWTELLHDHSEVTIVAKEFQTGLGNRDRGIKAIDAVARLQDRCGRDLHFLAVGGASYRDELRSHFSGWSIIDSVPYMKAVKRRSALYFRGRLRWTRQPDADVADLFEHNLASYEKWLGV
ncbi:MAG: DUF4417 domain-containing protein [Patescibacteria group bacterium]